MSEGKKYDQGKAPISLIPVEALIEQAKVFDFGAKKYGRHNFRLGMDHTRVLDAALRHILAIVNGEDNDPESGLPHYAHALCCLSMYGYFKANGVGKDDRAKTFLDQILVKKSDLSKTGYTFTAEEITRTDIPKLKIKKETNNE